MPFKNRIRLPLYIKAPQFPTEANRFRLADGSTKTLSVIIRKTYNLVTDWMPARMHQRLTIALNHDTVNIEGDRYAGGVSVDGEYKIDWIDFLDYPIAPAEVQIQVTPFAATNDNCQTCEEASQLDAVDDTVEETIEEGGTVEYNVFTNDTICCFPFTAEIVSFNPDFVDTVTIDEETGVVTITAKDPAPLGELRFLARYRITCSDGTFDEADIFGTVNGSIAGCEDPDEPVYENIEQGQDELTWLLTGDFEWELRLCDAPGIIIESGTTSLSTHTFTDLSPGACYIFSIRHDCGAGSFSGWASVEFNVPAAESDCGRFEVTADDGTLGNDFYNFSFMDCNGNILTLNVQNLHIRTICMLTDFSDNPIYFEGSVPWISYEFITNCGG